MSVRVIEGDCLEQMRALIIEGVTVQAIVTDPPAGINFMGRDWDADKGGRDHWVAWMQEVAATAIQLLPPGGHAFVWALPRTSHWTATAWENAGWQVRDRCIHLFGTGFPKSHNLHGDWEGWGTALKPAAEDWWLFRKPLAGMTVAANVLQHGTGAINIDACRVPSKTPVQRAAGSPGFGASREDGYAHGTGREYGTAGRWPANVVHDGSDEVEAAFAAFGEKTTNPAYGTNHAGAIWGSGKEHPVTIAGSTGTASRFFYSAKASKADRAGSKHPTVKNLALMRWLVRMVTPPGGTVLDPFAGSGTTLAAAMLEGFASIGIEREPEYAADARRRIAAVAKGDPEDVPPLLAAMAAE